VLLGRQEAETFGRIWGTGGWLMPELREGLDWGTLIRLMGWEVDASAQIMSGSAPRTILAAPSQDVDDAIIAELVTRLSVEPILLIVKAARPGGALDHLCGVTSTGSFSGRTLHWTGPGIPRTWECGRP